MVRLLVMMCAYPPPKHAKAVRSKGTGGVIAAAEGAAGSVYGTGLSVCERYTLGLFF